ncbi:MAG: 50S ribosomal protein L11 methyltransferase [Hyphomicrobiales bacterium]|nr:50S ribosomal protein L11 methyltransferase [Hyphomicrobiales bacterium]
MTQPPSNSAIQYRHYVEADFEIARQIYDLLDSEFEEDSIAVTFFEIDEVEAIWCACIYTLEYPSDDFKSRMVTILSSNGFKSGIESEIIHPTDWVAQTLRKLCPVRAGRFLIHGSHDNDVAGFSDIPIRIDAGLAFGTGHHGTTAGCLEMLERQLKSRKFNNPLDVGTGSGVLAIAVAKACKTQVLASDIDPVATRVARQNARFNNVGKWVRCVTAAGFNHRGITARTPYDLIIANILARPLQNMAKEFAAHLAADGVVILSGLLPHQKARIIAAFQIQHLKFVKAHIRDGWLTLVLKK